MLASCVNNNFSIGKINGNLAQNGNHMYLQKKKAVGSSYLSQANTRITKNKKPELKVKLINTVFDIEAAKVSEEIYQTKFCSNLLKSQGENAFDIERMDKRQVCKLTEPLKDSFIKTEENVKKQPLDEEDPAFKLINKHKYSRKTLQFGNKYFNADSLDLSSCSSDESFNNSFSETLKKRIVRENDNFTPLKHMQKITNSKKLKKPKILKSDGKTVTAESVLRMVDPSFLVSSDAEDSSLMSINSSNVMTSNNTNKFDSQNLLDDLQNFDQIDKTLFINENMASSIKPKSSYTSTNRSNLSKGFTIDDFDGNLFNSKSQTTSPKEFQQKEFISPIKKTIW